MNDQELVTCNSVCNLQRSVHIVEHDDAFRDTLETEIRWMGFQPTTYRSTEHFLAAYSPQPIECCLLDLKMDDLYGLELQPLLLVQYRKIQTIVISAYNQTADITQAARNGFIAYLRKPLNDQKLHSMVDAALQKSEQNFRKFLNHTQALGRLSERENEVLKLLVAAYLTRKIAHLLGISPKTVEKHRINIFDKVGVNGVPELIRFVYGID